MLARQTRWTLHVLGILSVVTLVAMNLVGPQAYVADRNLERALDPALVPPGGRTGLDGAYLASLGDEAVPPVVAAFDRLGAAEQAGAGARSSSARDRALATDPALHGLAVAQRDPGTGARGARRLVGPLARRRRRLDRAGRRQPPLPQPGTGPPGPRRGASRRTTNRPTSSDHGDGQRSAAATRCRTRSPR